MSMPPPVPPAIREAPLLSGPQHPSLGQEDAKKGYIASLPLNVHDMLSTLPTVPLAARTELESCK